MSKFEEKVKAVVAEYDMFSENDIILTALSGGSDSVSLLYCLNRIKSENNLLIAAHLNHGIRGDDADNDERFCVRLCESLGVEIFTEQVDVPFEAEQLKTGIEETARRLRYEFLLRSAEKIRADYGREVVIATAHNSDDNAETVIFNIARGSGLNGLKGIQPVRMNGDIKIVRPVIDCTKAEILEYINENGLSYATDKTNGEDIYTRNFIRHNIIGGLSKKFPMLTENISRLTKIVSDDMNFLDSYAENIIKENNINDIINIDLLSSQHIAVQKMIIMRIASNISGAEAKNGVEYKHIEIIIEALSERIKKRNKTIDLPNGLEVKISYGNLIFRKKKQQIISGSECELKFGRNYYPIFDCFIECVNESFENVEKNEEIIYNLFINRLIDSDKIKGVIFIRKRREGDSYIFNRQMKSVKKNYINYKIEKDKRDTLPVFCDGEGIIIASGLPAADRVRPDENTKNILRISVEK